MLASDARETVPLIRDARRSSRFAPVALSTGVAATRARRAGLRFFAASAAAGCRTIRTTKRLMKPWTRPNFIDAVRVPFPMARCAISVLLDRRERGRQCKADPIAEDRR